MSLDTTENLAAALGALPLIMHDDEDMKALGAQALAAICDFVPETRADAGLLLGYACGLTENEEVCAFIGAALVAIANGALDDAIVALSAGVTAARSAGAILSERMMLNVLAGPVPAILSLRPALPWEASSTRH